MTDQEAFFIPVVEVLCRNIVFLATCDELGGLVDNCAIADFGIVTDPYKKKKLI